MRFISCRIASSPAQSDWTAEHSETMGSSQTVDDRVAFLPHLLLTVWGLLFHLSSPPTLPLTPFAFIFPFRPLACLTTDRPSPYTSKQHSTSFFLLFFPQSLHWLALFFFFFQSFLLSFFSPEPSLLLGDPSPLADSHRPWCPPPPPHPIPPLSSSFCRFRLTAHLHPLWVSAPLLQWEKETERERTAEQSCLLNEGMILDRMDKKEDNLPEKCRDKT